MTPRTLIVLPGRDDVIHRVAEDVVETLTTALQAQPVAHLALTGGTVGIGVLNDVGARFANIVDWSRVHLWWSDERWVPSGDADRNDAQASAGFLARVGVPDAHVHRMPAADQGYSLADGALRYEDVLRTQCVPDGPAFDVALLGIGPDAHVASLFPGHEAELREHKRLCVPVSGSPKPPSERLTLTLPILNRASRVWIVAAGEDKREALTATLGAEDALTAPSSAVHGTLETRVYCDKAAAPEATNA